MSLHAASSAQLENSEEEGQEPIAEGTPVEEGTPVDGASLAPVASDVSVAASRWTVPSAHSPARRWEVTAMVILTILVHAGFALGAHLDSKKPRAAKRWTKVEIDVSRPPPPPPKAVVPPPEPPKPVKAAPPPKPLAAVEKVVPEKAAPEPPPPQDTGSSLPSDPEGELFRGTGGLGTAAPAPPAPPAPVVAPPPPPAPVIQAKEGANYLKNPRPPYPARAQREGWEGTTLLRVQVSALGKPGSIQIQTSSGRSVLDDAAIEAVKRWTFTPATQGGTAISGYVTVPIVFKLQ